MASFKFSIAEANGIIIATTEYLTVPENNDDNVGLLFVPIGGHTTYGFINNTLQMDSTASLTGHLKITGFGSSTSFSLIIQDHKNDQSIYNMFYDNIDSLFILSDIDLLNGGGINNPFTNNLTTTEGNIATYFFPTPTPSSTSGTAIPTYTFSLLDKGTSILLASSKPINRLATTPSISLSSVSGLAKSNYSASGLTITPDAAPENPSILSGTLAIVGSGQATGFVLKITNNVNSDSNTYHLKGGIRPVTNIPIATLSDINSAFIFSSIAPPKYTSPF